MQFEVEFYVGAGGSNPLEDFFEELRDSDPRVHQRLMNGLAKLRFRENHRMPLCRPLGDGLFELRHLGLLNARVLWFFVVGSRIVAVHAIRNKAQALPEGDLRLARTRKADWLRRHQA